MPREDPDAAYLWDMLDAARAVRDFATAVSLHEYMRDRKLQLAVERAVEIIGEAARHVSPSFKAAHPDVPWAQIVAQRHVLAHEYGDIKQDHMWRLATMHVPALITTLERLMPPLPPGRDN